MRALWVDNWLDNLPEAPKERNLWAAVLERAIWDLSHPDVSKEDRRSARAWFFSECSREFSFYWVCMQLDFNPKIVRAEIKKHLQIKIAA